MHQLAKRNKDKVIDLLTERLQFERSGVKLYDSVLEKVKTTTDPGIQRMVPQLKEHRDQEQEHAKWKSSRSGAT